MTGNSSGSNLWKSEALKSSGKSKADFDGHLVEDTGNAVRGNVLKSPGTDGSKALSEHADSNAEIDTNNEAQRQQSSSNNHNSSILGLTDEPTTLLNDLNSRENGNSGKDLQQTDPNKNSTGMDKGTLDMLLQHYQELLNRSNSTSNSPQFLPAGGPNGSPSPNVSGRTHTIRNPDDNSAEYRSTYPEVSGVRGGVSTITPKNGNKRDRADENINVHELLKRNKTNMGVPTNSADKPSSSSITGFIGGENNDRSVTHNNEDSGKALPMQYYHDAIQNWYKSQPGSHASPNQYQRSNSNSNIDVANKISPSSNYEFNQFNYGVNVPQTQQTPFAGQQNMSTQQGFTQPAIQYPRSSYFVGPTSIFDINLINHMKLDKIEQVQLSKNMALRKVSPTAQFVLKDDFNQELYLKQEHDLDLVEKLVHPHGKILVEIFFKLIHPYIPILHERVFLEKYSRSYRELTAPILASIYSLALQWWDFHPQLIGFPKPDVVKQLNDIALRTFYEVFERPKLSIVQAGLLILHCRSESPNNWVLCSEVVALSEELGLGIDCQDWRLPKWERGLRRRLAWAVWCLDKWTALLESRHSHLILGRNWMVKLLSDDDFPDKSPVISSSQNSQSSNRPLAAIGNSSILDISPTNEDFDNGKMLFRQMVSLSIILGEIMDTFYTIGAMNTTTKIEHVLKLAKPLQLKLREWYHSLPHALSMGNYTPGSYNSNATLTLAYFAAEITLHRKIISTLSVDSPEELVPVCRSAAKTRLIAAIEFIRDLKTEHINSFWYTCSTGNLALIGTFSALLYVTSPTKDESIVFRDCLRNYIWILRMSSKSFEKAGHALDRIHMLLTQIPGLLTDEPASQPFVPPKSQSPYNPTSGYGQQNSQNNHPNPQSQTQGNSQQQFYNSQSPFYGSPPGSYDTLNSSAFKQLRNIPPEILQSLTSLQSNLPTMSSASFAELNDLLDAHSKGSNSQLSEMSHRNDKDAAEKSPQRSIPLIVNDKLKSLKNPITPASASGTMTSEDSPRKESRASPGENTGTLKGNTNLEEIKKDNKGNVVKEST